MRRTLLSLTAAAAGAALLSCAPRPGTQASAPQRTDPGTPTAQPQARGSVGARPRAPATARPAAPALAQQRAGAGGGAGALPPGDAVPGWSGPPRGGSAAGGGPATAPGSPGLVPGPTFGENTRGGAMMSGAPNYAPGPSSSSMIGGEPARVGGAPPGDTSRAPGSSGIGGAGVGNTGGVGGPIR